MKRMLRTSALILFFGGAAANAQPVTAAAKGNRAALEEQFRQRTAKLTQQRLQLTDAQLEQLEQSNALFAPRLNQLAVQERETRRQLRLEMTSDQPNQQHVSGLLDTALQLQKQRITLVEAEQKDIARFLTPVQRARYIGLQAQFRKRAQELSRQNGGQRQGLGLKRMRPPANRLP
jgi:protein CpxP